MLIEPLRNPYKAQFYSSPSDLMKSTVVDESLSTNAARVLFQRKTTDYILVCIVRFVDLAFVNVNLLSELCVFYFKLQLIVYV